MFLCINRSTTPETGRSSHCFEIRLLRACLSLNSLRGLSSQMRHHLVRTGGRPIQATRKTVRALILDFSFLY